MLFWWIVSLINLKPYNPALTGLWLIMLCVINAPGFDLASCWISLTPDTHTLFLALLLFFLFLSGDGIESVICARFELLGMNDFREFGYYVLIITVLLLTHFVPSDMSWPVFVCVSLMQIDTTWEILSFLISLQLLRNHSCALGSLVKKQKTVL